MNELQVRYITQAVMGIIFALAGGYMFITGQITLEQLFALAAFLFGIERTVTGASMQVAVKNGRRVSLDTGEYKIIKVE